ncbi:MAG TPA: hypothetical protein P5164_04915 [Thermoanaerobaculia bacterium]|nr:hypothetical protein [Thermoanaerobaculia bacterium]
MRADLDSNALLLVEDDVPFATCTAEFLSRRGHGVELAFDLVSASCALARRAWPAVVTDVDLSGPSGTEGLEVVSAAAALRRRPAIVVWSGCVSEGLRREALRLGADAVLEKGSLWELEAELARQLAKRQPTGAVDGEDRMRDRPAAEGRSDCGKPKHPAESATVLGARQ